MDGYALKYFAQFVDFFFLMGVRKHLFQDIVFHDDVKMAEEERTFVIINRVYIVGQGLSKFFFIILNAKYSINIPLTILK